jgi:hypothetical protein
MKKALVSVFGLAVLAGCSSSYDYYNGGVKYAQEGKDCVYYSSEQGNKFISDIGTLASDKKIVYRNTQCSALYEKDIAGQNPRQDRKVLTLAAAETPSQEIKEEAAPITKCEFPTPAPAAVMEESKPVVTEQFARTPVAAAQPAYRTRRTESYVIKRRYLIVSQNQ